MAAPHSPPSATQAHLEVHEGREPDAWDHRVKALGGGPFHCAAWARYRSSAPHKRPLFFTWFTAESTEPIAVALAICTAIPGPLRTSSMEFDAPPATRLDPRRLTPDIEQWMEGRPGLADAWLGSFDAERDWLEATGAVTRIEFRVTPATQDELFAGMRTLARRSVRRARRSGIEIDPDSRRTRDFVDLYGETLVRLRRTKGASTLLVDPAGFAGQLALLRDEGAARLFMAADAGIPVAGAVFTVFGRRAFYLIGASNARGRETGAMTAVLYRAMCDFSAGGFDCMNLGGVSADAHLPSARDHGLYEFKRGLGAVAHPCRDARLVVRPARRRVIQAARWTRSTVVSLVR